MKCMWVLAQVLPIWGHYTKVRGLSGMWGHGENMHSTIPQDRLVITPGVYLMAAIKCAISPI